MALLFMHDEARELGLLPDDDSQIVDYMHPRPTGDARPYLAC